jgi:hypothetical protein
MAASENKPELATIVRRFGKELMATHSLSAQQVKALHNIVQCRTSAMGGHEEICEHCDEKRYSYNSCGDRHCPKCQLNKQVRWVDDITGIALPVKHFHVVFTVPHVLNKVCLWNQNLYYNILFGALWRTLHSFGYSEYGVESGAIAVLHSWGQNLSLHPHVHCIVPAAGYTLKGQYKHIGKGNHLYPVHQLSMVFKGKFLDSLKRKLRKMNMPDAFGDQIRDAYKTPWVVNIEPSLAGAGHVIRYLGQYTHRVAISNQRILQITQSHVRFIAKDYRDNARQKPVPLTGVEFLRRFCQHVFPKGFVRIRRFGIYSPNVMRRINQQLPPQQKVGDDSQPPEAKGPCTSDDSAGPGPDICPKCRIGRMRIVAVLPRIRSPAASLPALLLSKLL